jgi:hypothetical protein
METSKTSKKVGALLALIGVLGLVILGLDQILREAAPMHVYGLVLFVIIDFAVAGFVIVKPTKTTFTLAALWSVLRIVIQLGDVSQAHVYGMRYTEFANYLFNPAITTSPNPPGVPGAIIDLILLLEVLVIVLARGARSRIQNQAKD